jgi:hypothetical protein
VLRDTGRKDEALPLLARAFEVRTRELARDDRVRVATTRDYIGLLRELGRLGEANAAQARADAAPAR